jgi:hypothetical protein
MLQTLQQAHQVRLFDITLAHVLVAVPAIVLVLFARRITR